MRIYKIWDGRFGRVAIVFDFWLYPQIGLWLVKRPHFITLKLAWLIGVFRITWYWDKSWRDAYELIAPFIDSVIEEYGKIETI